MDNLNKGYVSVSGGHELYYEVYGNPDGIPILFLHGGPGAGFFEMDKRFFDPKIHKVIFFDQRGASRSKPFGSIVNNETDLLIDDITHLLKVLGVEKVVLFAGSWGCTLALVYAIKFPFRIMGMILRGVFLGNKKAIDHYINGGVEMYYPEEWERFVKDIPTANRENIAKFYLQKMKSNSSTSERFAYQWAHYEISIFKKGISSKEVENIIELYPYQSLAILEAHYLSNNCFIEENYILNNIHFIKNIPVSIIQGRHDVICPPIFAYQLHQKLNKSNLLIVEAAHSDSEPEIEKNLISELQILVGNLIPFN
ncbi:prolyl aminopeptidase [Aquimarina sp. I32.4]|uniref:prolyl aminopeptidase n=1 Tax=Aquimarina sp. I32.4 TaxID=2053903 RepID=UPI000CDE5693|nr:prolyl aminopeptidase [Aquimarina sp. I32.4]